MHIKLVLVLVMLVQYFDVKLHVLLLDVSMAFYAVDHIVLLICTWNEVVGYSLEVL